MALTGYGERSIKHLDLFSGIGGFALAADWTWDRVDHTFCEINPFDRAELAQRYPNTKIYGDIRTVRGEEIGEVDLLTGGFPCQPFSQAGLRRGETDDRYLWPEMLRIIRETKPAWIIGENVIGIVSMALDRVCDDLEAEGYEVRTFIIPACAVGASHLRNRVWIVAHTDTGRNRRYERSRVPEEAAACAFLQGNWLEVAAQLRGVDDGFPDRLDRFKALGNAIVPAIAHQIMMATDL